MADRSPEPADEREWRKAEALNTFTMRSDVHGHDTERVFGAGFDAAMAAADERERARVEWVQRNATELLNAVAEKVEAEAQVRALTEALREIVAQKNTTAGEGRDWHMVLDADRKMREIAERALRLPVPVEGEPEEEN